MGGTVKQEAEEMQSARRQARRSISMALHRVREYLDEGVLVTPSDLESIVRPLQTAYNHLSTMEDHYAAKGK